MYFFKIYCLFFLEILGFLNVDVFLFWILIGVGLINFDVFLIFVLYVY